MRIAKVREVKTPTRGTGKSAGLDFYIPEDFSPCVLISGGDVKIPSGIKAQVPVGSALIVCNKSGIALDKRLQVGACVIDEDFQGEIQIHIYNCGYADVRLRPGMKIVQLICVPVIYTRVDVVDEDKLFDKVTERGEGGFGSTNKADEK